MTVSELDMIYIESILKASSSVDVTVRSVPAEATNQRPSRPPSEHSLPPSQHGQLVEAAVASSVETASNDGRPGRTETANNQLSAIITSPPGWWALASPAMGPWDTCPLDFQQFKFSSSLYSCTESDSDFVQLPVQTHLLTLLFRVILCATYNFRVVLCPRPRCTRSCR